VAPRAIQNRVDALAVWRFGEIHYYYWHMLHVLIAVCTVQPNKRLMRKLPTDTECASLLVGHVDFLDDLAIAYFRFRSPTVIDGLTEVALSTRFLFVAVGPSEVSSIVELSELGRAFATLLNDKVSTTRDRCTIKLNQIKSGLFQATYGP